MYRNFPKHFVRGMFEKLAPSLARWHTKWNNWHHLWQVSTFIGTLACKNEKLANVWHVGTWVSRPRWHA